MRLNAAHRSPGLRLLVPPLRALVGVRRRTRRWPLIPGVILLGFFVMGTFAPLISPHSPSAANLRFKEVPPMWMEGGTSRHILGADKQGMDILSRIIHGTRVSLVVAGSVILMGVVLGTSVGLVSGYFGGWIDEILMRIVDIFYAMPFITVALVVLVAIGAGYGTVIGLLALFSWVGFARQVRAETLYLKALDYVAMAQVAGASTPRILLRHILPGVINTIVVIATLSVGGLILAESGLSYLGLGIPHPTPAWGGMVASGRSLLATSWWISFFPGMAIFVTIVGFNFMGDWLRDTLDPRLRQVQ